MAGMVAAAIAGISISSMYDVTMPTYTSTCRSGCLPWAEAAKSLAPSLKLTQQAIDDMFILKSAGSAAAGAECAMPGATAGTHEKDCGLGCDPHGTEQWSYIYDSYAGPWCFCKDPVPGAENSSQYCAPAMETPEQINLQYASPTAVVVGFVTYELGGSTGGPPEATLAQTDPASNATTVLGVTHRYAPPGRNGTAAPAGLALNTLPYMMHYVTLAVEPGHQYLYRVRSGAAEARWSEEYRFRAPGGGSSTGVPTTRIATYGDMGHSRYNCMHNLKLDVAAGLVDVVVHMGDHCYDIGESDDRRGDAYMNAFQPLLTELPWFPIIGNHEGVYHLKPGQSYYGDGDSGHHYEAIAWGEAYGVSGPNISFPGGVVARPPPSRVGSTATTALGHHLASGTLYGMGTHGPIPSNTSRYTSADIGLIHMVGLDLNTLDAGQLAWLEADLAQANENRTRTPWIMVASHFPLFHSVTSAHANMSAAHYVGDELMGDYAIDGTKMKFAPCGTPGCQTVGEFQLRLGQQLQPLFQKYGVDLYNAGHVHSYESTWPLCDFTTGALCRDSNGTWLQSLDEPRGTVHITEGNGGVPGVPGTFSAKSCTVPPPAEDGGATAAKGGPWPGCHMTGTGGAYGRIAATPTTLTYTRVANNGGTITDSWTITQHNHGPFTGRQR